MSISDLPLSPQRAASETGRPTQLSAPITEALSCRMSNENPNTPSSPSCGTRPRTLSYGPARAYFCRLPTASKQSPTTMEKSSPLTSRSQPRWVRYPILPSPITRGNAASTNTPTAYSDSTSQKVQISLLCQMPMSKGSRINSTHAPERYSATELLVRFSSTPKICPLHFAVEWAIQYAVPLAKLFRQVAPWCAGPHQPQHSVDEQTIVFAVAAPVTRLAGNKRCDVVPLRIRQFSPNQDRPPQLRS